MSDSSPLYLSGPRYYAMYSMGGLFDSEHALPVGSPDEDENEYYDTIFYYVKLSQVGDDEELHHVGDLRIRRVQVARIVNARRSVGESMDQIDALEHEIYEAVWDDELGGYREEFEAMCGDLVIFEDLYLKEGVALHGFDINKILDDMVYHASGDSGMVVYVESYGSFTRFNVDACHALEGIGFARASTMAGLATARRDWDLEEGLDN